MARPQTIYRQFERTVRAVPDRPFCWYEGATVTYAETMRAVERRATFLHTEGVSVGDRVGVYLSNHPEFLYLLLATARLGATFVPIDYRQEGSVLDYLLADADVSVLVVEGNRIRQFAPSSDAVTGAVYFLDGPGRESDYEAAVATADPAEAPVATVAPTDVAILSYTSGTTGPPKGVRNPHYAYVNAGYRLAEACGTDETDRALLVLPLFHANPTTYGLMQMLAVGGSVAPVQRFSASRFFDTARASESTFFTHVGSILEILDRTLRDGDVDTTSPLKFAVGGAAQFDRQSEFEARTDVQLVRLYGLSEVGAGLLTTCRYRPDRAHGERHQGVIADQPFDVRILDDDGRDVAGDERSLVDDGRFFADDGERGEIVVRPDEPGLVFRGYRGKPDATVEMWQDLWIHTGDVGIVEDGVLRYVGREQTNIRKMGENVSPWEVESALSDWERVADAVAVGVPDDVAGEEIGLWVVAADVSLTESDVHERCRTRLAAHHRPRYVAFVDRIPRTSTQKIDRGRLHEWSFDGAWDARDHEG